MSGCKVELCSSMAPRSFCGGVKRRGRVPEVLYIGREGAVAVDEGEGGGESDTVEQAVLEDEKALSKESGGEGVREVGSPVGWCLREGMIL